MANSAVVGILRALLTLDTAQFEKGVKRAQDELKTFSRETKQIGLQATQLGSQLTRTITLPLLGAGAAAAKVAMDFESSFAGVRKTVDATEAEFAMMAKQFRNLSKEIPVNVNELNRLGEAAGALGIPKAEIVDFAKVMALLGVTTNVTSDQAAESIAQIQTIFQAAGRDTDRFAATLVDLGNKGASTEAQILELANRLASAGNAIGMSQATVLGFASAIANVGINAEAGGTAISKVFSDISIAVSKGGDDLAAFAEMAGKSAEDFAALFKRDAAAAVLAFIEGLGKAEKAGGDLNLMLEELGFKEARQARALRDLALSGDNLAKSLRIAATAWRENSALTEEARKRFETTHSQLTLLWNRVKDVGITLGNALLPLIKTMVSALGSVTPVLERAAVFFAAMPVPIQAAAVAMGLMAAAAGPLIFAFGQLALSASALAGAFTKKGIATKLLTADLGLLTLATRAAAVDAALAAKGYTALAAAQTVAGGTSVGVGLKLGAATIAARASAVASQAAAIGQAGLAVAMNAVGGSALVMGVRMAVATAATKAAAAAAVVATGATAGLSLAYLALTRVLLPVAAAFALFKFGEWIERTTGLATAVGKLTLKLGEQLRLVPQGTAQWYADARARTEAARATRDQAEAQRALEDAYRQSARDRITGDDLKRQVDAIRTEVIALNKEGRMTPDVWRRVANELKGLQAQGATLTKELQFTVDSWGSYTPPVKAATTATASMTAELKAAEAQLAKLTGAQRAEIQAGIALGNSNKEIAESLNNLFPKLQMTEQAVDILRGRLSGAGRAAKQAAKDFNELTGVTARTDALELAAKLESGAIRLSGLTADAQREVLETLGAGIDSWKALGDAVPASVRKQFDAVMQLRGIPDMMKEVGESAREASNKWLSEFWDEQKRRAEATSSAMLQSIARAGQAMQESAQIGRDIHIRRSEHALEMAKLEGKSWQELAALDEQLQRERLAAAIAAATERFQVETMYLDHSSLEYKALAEKHRLLVQQMEEDHRLSETAKREELRRTHNIWLRSFETLKEGLSRSFDNLSAIIFGSGDDAASDEAKKAKAHFHELKRSGTASAEELTRAFQAWREAESKANSAFADRFKSLWNGIKRALTDILDQILGYFVKSFLGGMLKALAGTGLGQRVGGWLMKGLGLGGGGAAGTAMDIGGGLLGKVPGLSGLLGLGGGLATAGFSTAAGGTLAASMIAPSIASAAVPAAITSAGVSAGGAAAGGAAAGGGLGATVAGLATNPITIAAAAAIAGGFLLKKLGLFDNSPSDLSRGIFARMRMRSGASESELPEWIRSDESTMRKIREGRLFGGGLIAQPRPFVPAMSASAAVPSTAMQRTAGDGGGGQIIFNVTTPDVEGWNRAFDKEIVPRVKRELMMPRHGLMPLIQQRVLS